MTIVNGTLHVLWPIPTVHRAECRIEWESWWHGICECDDRNALRNCVFDPGEGAVVLLEQRPVLPAMVANPVHSESKYVHP